MYQYSISLDGEMVGVQSDTDLSSIFEKWKKLLHLASVAVYLGGEHEFNLEYTSAPGCLIHYLDRRVQVTMPMSDLQTGEVLLYAVLSFLEVLHQRNSVVTMHAAAVELDGQAILLIGRAGAGKTSLTLSLCRNHRAKLIGNDIVKVGLSGNKVIACAGSKYFFLRQESIKRNIPDLLSLFPQSNKDPWTHKIYCLPDALGITTCGDSIPIARSYLVHIDETMEDVHTSSADRMDTRLYLNENMSRYIRGTAISLFGNTSRFIGYVPSFDSPGFFEMRTMMIETLISSTETTYLAGNIHDTCKYIVSGVRI